MQHPESHYFIRGVAKTKSKLPTLGGVHYFYCFSPSVALRIPCFSTPLTLYCDFRSQLAPEDPHQLAAEYVALRHARSSSTTDPWARIGDITPRPYAFRLRRTPGAGSATERDAHTQIVDDGPLEQDQRHNATAVRSSSTTYPEKKKRTLNPKRG